MLVRESECAWLQKLLLRVCFCVCVVLPGISIVLVASVHVLLRCCDDGQVGFVKVTSSEKDCRRRSRKQ